MKKTQKFTLLHLSSVHWISIALYLILTALFIFFYEGFVEGRHTAASWLDSAWNSETDYEHGWMIPLLSGYMVWHAASELKDEKLQGSAHGLWFILLGGMLCLLAVRTQQPRIAVGALPFLLDGMVWYHWGRKAAFKCAFPIFFLWLAVPLPGFQQATVSLQLISAEAAHWGSGICGVETIMQGTNIASADGSWDAYNIAGGCSGIRSLMALFMISIAWGYLAGKLALWKRICLALSAIPLAILGNAFRVASIFVCAEYINPAFAGKTWHDWSGLLFFFPATLIGLVFLHSILAGEVPFLKKRKVIITRRNQNTEEKKGEEA